ncbi:sorting nexin-7-like [Clavelina lepadiformis]|uniref:sorting nexin-7-like n=1 Tax=Clavelina lepadiformis TaxID=159417 RepID=UPI00404321E1
MAEMENEQLSSVEPTQNDPLQAAKQDTKVNESSDDDGELEFETFSDKLNIEDDETIKKDDDDDLYVSVDDPDKHITTMETYITYRVMTKTTRSTFDECEFEVRRRYQDFVWLRENLIEDHPTFIIPPLPAKFVMKGMLDRFNSTFTETRCNALHKFLYRISKHPVVSFNDHFKTFLTSKEFSAARKQSFMSRVSGSLKWTKVQNPEFEEVLENVTIFGEKMGVADRIAERLLLEKRELITELREFAPTFTEWASSEDDVIEPIMQSVSSSLESCAEEAEKNVKAHELEFLPPLKEYALYADAVKQVLKKRDIFQSQFERCNEDLKRKKDEKDNLPKSDQSYSIGAMLGKNPELVREQKEEKLSQQIEELSIRREMLSDDLERANTNLRADLDRWNELKIKDVAELLSTFAQSQINYHNGCLSAWEGILPTMQDPEEKEEVMDPVT